MQHGDSEEQETEFLAQRERDEAEKLALLEVSEDEGLDA